MQMSQLVIAGIAGRMGRTILQVWGEEGYNQKMGMNFGIESENSRLLGSRLSSLVQSENVDFDFLIKSDMISKGRDVCGTVTTWDGCVHDFQIMIDFSSPSALRRNVDLCVKYNAGIVIGTTGLSEEDMLYLKSKAHCIPIFLSFNMSIGIHIIRKIFQSHVNEFSKGSIEIIETHHKNKVDAPSGTALLLANSINESLQEIGQDTRKLVLGRSGISDADVNSSIGIHAIRGGDVVGEHMIRIFSFGEQFEITHKALDRSIFARGALKVASWMLNKENGFYTMDDYLS